MKKLILLFLLCFIFPAISFAQSAPNILILGDSISLGEYPCVVKKYVTSANFLGFDAGKCTRAIAEVGIHARDMAERFYTVSDYKLASDSYRPDYLFLLLGTNDAVGDNPNNAYQGILDIIVDRVTNIRRFGLNKDRVFVSLLPPLRKTNNVDQVNQKLQELSNVATIVDQSDVTIDMISPDNIHPTDEGAAVIACNFLQTSGLKNDCAKPKPTPKVSLPPKIPTRGKKCPTGDSLGFAPLRPDPGEPCEEYVPVDTQFACGSSITPSEQESFDPYGDGCDKNSDGTVTCYKAENFDVSLDLAKANIGILGNTQDQNLTDEQKVNEYLSWYLSGVPQVGDQKKPDDDKLINFSGPIRKLIPYDLGYSAKETIINQNSDKVHNYKVGDDKSLSDFAGIYSFNRELLKSLFQNIPFSSLEDTVGEYIVSATDLKRNNLQDTSVLSPGDTGFQIPVKLTITSTQKAN